MSIVYLWPTFTGVLTLDIVSVRADGTEFTSAIDGEHLRVHVESASWNAIELDVAAAINEATPEGLENVEAHALVSSPRSAYRRPFPLSVAPTESGLAATGTVVVRHSDLVGAVDLSVLVTALVAGRRRVVGVSSAWKLVVDAAEAPRPPGAPPFKFRKVDFASPEAPMLLREHSKEVAYFELSDPPVLWVNDGIEGLWALLHATHAKDDRRRQKDIASATIARVILDTVFRSAFDELVVDGLDEPMRTMHRDVCAQLAERFPDVADEAEFYEVIKKLDSANPGDRDRFWGHIDLTLDELSGVSAAFARNISEVKHG